MRPQEKQRLIISLIIAGIIHLVVFFLRFTLDFSQPPEEDYIGPVTISFAQDIVPEETPPSQESETQENAVGSQEQDVPDNPVTSDDPAPPQTNAQENAGNDTAVKSGSQQNSAQDRPVDTPDDPVIPGSQDNPSPEETSEVVDPAETGSNTEDARPGRREIVTTPDEDQENANSDTSEPEDDTPSLNIGDDFANLFNSDDDPSTEPNPPSPGGAEQGDYTLEGAIQSLEIRKSVEPEFGPDVPQGRIAFRIQVLIDGKVNFLEVDFNKSDDVFSSIGNRSALVTAMRRAISQWELTPPPGGQPLTGIGYIRITK
jgi:hypothetical protein